MGIIEVKVKPNSNERKIVLNEKEIIIYLKSPPEKNKANLELINLLHNLFQTKVRIIRGKQNRKKTVLIEGLTKEEILKKLRIKNLD